MEYNTYNLHSGKAPGADLYWEKAGNDLGIPLITKHWRPEDYTSSSPRIKQDIDLMVNTCAEVLKRPSTFSGIDLVKRNWFPVYLSQAVYAISTIIPSGDKDKGFVNRSGKEVVAGGTGWAVEMAIQMGKPVYMFDQGKENWYYWNQESGTFDRYMGPLGYSDQTPTLTQSFAGIGSRNLTEAGKQAILDVYTKTLNQ